MLFFDSPVEMGSLSSDGSAFRTRLRPRVDSPSLSLDRLSVIKFFQIFVFLCYCGSSGLGLGVAKGPSAWYGYITLPVKPFLHQRHLQPETSLTGTGESFNLGFLDICSDFIAGEIGFRAIHSDALIPPLCGGEKGSAQFEYLSQRL